MPTYYEYHPSYQDWIGVSTEFSGYSTTTVATSSGAGQTSVWNGTSWNGIDDQRGVYFYTFSDTSISIGSSLVWTNPVEQPSTSIATATTPPSVGVNQALTWTGTDWLVIDVPIGINTTIPNSNEVISLGSSTNRYKDLYVSEGTVYLGVHSLSISTNKLEYDGEEVVTGVGGTINTTFADITNINAGVVTATQIGSPGAGSLNFDGDLIPLNNRQQDLGHATKSYRKVYVKSGPKSIEFEDSGVGLGYTVNAQAERLLIFDGHELFFGDGDIGHHGNLSNIYASGIISASSGAIIGGISTFSGNLIPSVNDTYELGSVSNRWKDIYLDGGESVLNIGDVGIGVTNGRLIVDGREALDANTQGDIGTQGRLRNINLTGIITGYNAGIVTYYGDGNYLDVPVTSGGGGAICMKFKSSTNNSMSDPGSGKWRLNNSTQSNATQLAVDIKSDGGYNINNLLSAVTVGTKIFIQRKDKPDEYNVFRVNVVPTLQGSTSSGWYLFSDITNLRTGGSNISNDKTCVLCLKAPNQVEDEDITPSSVALGNGGPSWTNGTGTPEGVVTASVGSLYSRTDGGAGTTLYVKESGTGNTGWVAK